MAEREKYTKEYFHELLDEYRHKNDRSGNDKVLYSGTPAITGAIYNKLVMTFGPPKYDVMLQGAAKWEIPMDDGHLHIHMDLPSGVSPNTIYSILWWYQ